MHIILCLWLTKLRQKKKERLVMRWSSKARKRKAVCSIPCAVILILIIYKVYIQPWPRYNSMEFVLPHVHPEYLTIHRAHIPRIIHQVWHNQSIPDVYIDNIYNLTRDNPEWKYFLWTWDSGRKLLKATFPDLLPLFERTGVTEKSDILRYAVLYVYGGAYFDMDTVSVKPIDTFLKNSLSSENNQLSALDSEISVPTCLFSFEPPEHEFFYHAKPIVSTASVFCQKEHPFFLYILGVLNLFEQNKCDGAFHCTGPGALTKVLGHYTEAAETENVNSGITILESVYFQDKSDKTLRVTEYPLQWCLSNLFHMIVWRFENRFRWRFCKRYMKGDHLKVSDKAVTYHTYDHFKAGTTKFYIHIKDIVPYNTKT